MPTTRTTASYAIGAALQQQALSLAQRTEGLRRLRHELKEVGFAFVPSDVLRGWLNADLLQRGTSVKQEWHAFGKIWETSPVQNARDSDEQIYEHKKVYHSKYSVNAGETDINMKPLVRQVDGLRTDKDGELRQLYSAHESTSTAGQATPHFQRDYPGLPHHYDRNLLLQASQRLFAEVFHPVYQKEIGICEPLASTMFQFAYSTRMNLFGKGDPGPEGVHFDGAVGAMIIVVGRRNIRPGTGGTRIWSPDQPTGKPTPEDLTSGRLLLQTEPKDELDTLFYLDERVAHEAVAGEIIDGAVEAERNMLIMDFRRDGGSFFGDARTRT